MVLDDGDSGLSESPRWLGHLFFDLVKVTLVSVHLIDFLLSLLLLESLNVIDHAFIVVGLLLLFDIFERHLLLYLLVLEHLRFHLLLLFGHLPHCGLLA